MNFTYLVPFLSTIFYRWDGGESSVYLLFYDQSSTTPVLNYSLDHSGCDIAPKVNLSKKMIVFIRGWEPAISEIEMNLMDTLIKYHSDDIIMRVEYPFNSSYPISFFMADTVGAVLGNFFKCLNHSYNFPLENVRLIGHSQGAHISGVVGKLCNSLIKSIIGLDPAGPLYNVYGPIVGNRLAKSDAQTVEVIHTSTAEGTYLVLGDSDFYVNGGIYQPQCGPFDNSCNHFTSITYYTATIGGSGHPYIGTQCSNALQYNMGNCKNNSVAFMGGIAPDPKASGTYFLNI